MKTFETRLTVDKEVAFELEEFFALWNRGLRRAWSARFQRGLTEPQTRPFLTALGLTSNQADSILDEVATRYKMLRELKKTELAAARTGLIERRTALSEKRRYLLALQKRIAKALAKRPKGAHRRTTKDAERDRRVRKLHSDEAAATNWVAQKLKAVARKERQVARLEHELATGRFSLCFGSNKLLAQHPLRSPDATPYVSVEEWRQAWADARRAHIYAIGRVREPNGCREISWDAAERRLRIRLPDAQAERRMRTLEEATGLHILGDSLKTSPLRMRCRHLELEKVDFTGYDGRARAVLALATAQYPVTGKLVRRRLSSGDVAYYLQLSCEVSEPEKMGVRTRGALGLDLNAAGIGWSIVKPDGNREESGFEPYGLSGSTKARRTQVSQGLERLIRLAAEQGLAVAAERLDFGSVKATFKARGTADKGERRFRRIVSQLPTSVVRQLLASKCARIGLELYLVNPKYSSVGGWSKYGRVNADGIDEAAAHWIARQALYGTVYKEEDGVLLVKLHQERLGLPRLPEAWNPSGKKGPAARISWWSVARALGWKRSEWRQRLADFAAGRGVGPGPHGAKAPSRPSARRDGRTGVMGVSVRRPATGRVADKKPAAALL
jgi:IS605 OrfB family transposase